ncbi:hypothetical protein JOM56_000256 [Amanita muscaria]
MLDPSVSMFPNAQNVTITGGEFPIVKGNYIKNVYTTSNASTADKSARVPHILPLRPPSTLFTGRDRYLQVLNNYFSRKRDSERKKFLLYGMGGIGKTQICLKFIEQYGETRFSEIFWIDASSEHTIELCLRQIAQKHKVDSTPSTESALQWISGRKNWLMVFDNADGGYHVVEKFIPLGNRGSILITSRDNGMARITSGTDFAEVTEMGEEEAIALLLESAKVDNKSMIVAQKLVAALGYIPLAIDQAGAYVQSCDCGLDYYLELFFKHRAQLMSDKEFHGASLYEYSTYGTWEISIEEIKHRAEGESSLAAQSALILYNFFAFLHQDNISEEIFKNAALNFMSRKGERTNGLPQSISLLDSKTLLLNDDGNWDALQFQAGIRVLLSFSLIRTHEMLYFVHPLIQTWSRDRIPVENVSDCCKKSRALLACSFNYQDDYRFYTLLASHIKTNGEHAAQFMSDDQYFDDQNDRFAAVFDTVGDWNQAEKLWKETLNARETWLGTDHLESLDAMSYLANTYRKQGRWNEAEGLEVKVMETRKEILGALHPDTLGAMGNLALTYRNQGKWSEAEGLQVKVMEAGKETLGALHPDRALGEMGNLANTYRRQGKWNEAEGLQVKVMGARKEILGALHPDTLSAMGDLANTYSDQGKWNEAEGLEVKVMEARKEILGALHPATLSAMNNLALTYSEQGKWNEAEGLQVKVMEASKEILGALHPDTLSAMGNLALTYRNQGKWSEAEGLQVKVMEAGKEILGALHPDTLGAMGNLAFTYSDQGKWNEAEGLEVKVMEARKEMLGALHPDTLSAMGNLAGTYRYQGKWSEAEGLQMKVMEASKEILGALHPGTLGAMDNLAFTYSNQGKWNEAEGLQVKVMEARKEMLGTLHPDTLSVMGNLALTYRGENKVKDAKELLDATIKGMQQVLGVEHPTTLYYMQVLADRRWNAEVKESKNTIKDALYKSVNKIQSKFSKMKPKRRG